jgi:hypothetical protein
MATAIDNYGVGGYTEGLTHPAASVAAITTSDTVELTHVSRHIYVGGTGDISVVMRDSSTAVFKAVPVGTVLPIRVRRINATGTTATLLLNLY